MKSCLVRVVILMLVLSAGVGVYLGLYLFPGQPERPRLPLGLPETPVPPPERARLAIIIDDLGGAAPGTDELLALDRPLTFAVLPFLRFTAREAELARARGHQVILHLPMQPADPAVDPGPGAITVNLGDDEIRAAVRRDLEAVPGVVGVNNHMGSLATTDRRVMDIVMSVVAEAGLFFVDSSTARSSVVRAAARAAGVPTGFNVRFIDNVKDVETIKKELARIGDDALRSGQAITTGHAHPATARAVREMIPQLEARGIRLVFVSELVR